MQISGREMFEFNPDLVEDDDDDEDGAVYKIERQDDDVSYSVLSLFSSWTSLLWHFVGCISASEASVRQQQRITCNTDSL